MQNRVGSESTLHLLDKSGGPFSFSGVSGFLWSIVDDSGACVAIVIIGVEPQEAAKPGEMLAGMCHELLMAQFDELFPGEMIGWALPHPDRSALAATLRWSACCTEYEASGPRLGGREILLPFS
jgi:hypothetical protein